MIQIAFARHGLSVVAVTVNDNRDVHIAFGFTQRHAQKKLMRSMDKFYSK